MGVISKDKIHTPGELEGIYREFRFLSGLLHHAHIVRCSDMLHATNSVYLVIDYAGQFNLAQVVSSLPGQRLDEEATLHCFEQIVRSLVYCHSKDVSHRNLMLEHIVLSEPVDSKFHCTLIDFNCAMVARGGT